MIVVALAARNQVPAGGGTGIVIADEGIVLTNQHVIEGADPLLVTTSEGDMLDADLVASSPNATRHCCGSATPPVCRRRGWGAPVPFLSAKERTIQTPGGLMPGLLQTDAAANPGSSGGPLIDGLVEFDPGSVVALDLVRNGDETEVDVEFGSFPTG